MNEPATLQDLNTIELHSAMSNAQPQRRPRSKTSLTHPHYTTVTSHHSPTVGAPAYEAAVGNPEGNAVKMHHTSFLPHPAQGQLVTWQRGRLLWLAVRKCLFGAHQHRQVFGVSGSRPLAVYCRSSYVLLACAST